MSKEITLPSGAKVVLKDPSLLRVKDRKRVMKAADVEGGDLSRSLALADALAGMLIESWTFDLPIPNVDISSLGELEMLDYDTLVEETKEAQKYLFPSLGETVENEADPKAITENSNA